MSPCGGCGNGFAAGITSADLPPDLPTWFETTKAQPSDFHEHMDTLKELAAKCASATEVSGWNKPALLALAAGCTGTVTSYCHAAKAVWPFLGKLVGERFRPVAADEPADIEPTDLLMVDTLHRAPRVYQELTRYAPKRRQVPGGPLHRGPLRRDRRRSHPAQRRAGRHAGRAALPLRAQGVDRHPPRQEQPRPHGPVEARRGPQGTPGPGAKAINYAQAVARHIANGRKPASAETFELRMAECLVCPERAHDACAPCGCPLDAKLSWASETCGMVKINKPPKWGPEE